MHETFMGRGEQEKTHQIGAEMALTYGELLRSRRGSMVHREQGNRIDKSFWLN